MDMIPEVPETITADFLASKHLRTLGASRPVAACNADQSLAALTIRHGRIRRGGWGEREGLA